MTEYDYSPEAYQQYLHSQQKIAHWVHRTNLAPKADPYQAATPAFDIPKELLPDDRIRDPYVPTSAMKEVKKERRRRTPSERAFDRERKQDWKYSHREHTDAMRAAASRPAAIRTQSTPAPRTRKAYDSGPPPPQPPESRAARYPVAGDYPADHRFSDSQDTSSSSRTSHDAHTYPHSGHKHSFSMQPPIRVGLPGPMPYGLDYDPNVNAQIDTSPPQHRRKPKRSQTAPAPISDPLPPPPASAPVYPSAPYDYQGQPKYYPNTSNLQQHQHQQSPFRPSPYPHNYAASPLSPPRSAPAYPYPRAPAPAYKPFIPEPPAMETKPPPLIKRLFTNLTSGSKAHLPSGSSPGMNSSRSQSRSQSRPESPTTPTSPTKPRTSFEQWLGSPAKNKLVKSSSPRVSVDGAGVSRASLDRWPSSGGSGGQTDEENWFLVRSSLDVDKERKRQKEKERERDRDRERDREKDSDRSRAKSRVRDGERDRDRGRDHDQDQDRSRERRRDEKDRDKDRDREKPRSSHKSKSRPRERSRSRDRDKDRGRERASRSKKSDRERERWSD